MELLEGPREAVAVNVDTYLLGFMTHGTCRFRGCVVVVVAVAMAVVAVVAH